MRKPQLHIKSILVIVEVTTELINTKIPLVVGTQQQSKVQLILTLLE